MSTPSMHQDEAMALELVFYPDPILRRRAGPLGRIDDAVRGRIHEMFELMYRERGVGLAAPQVGWGARVFIVNTASDPDEGNERIYINPRITAAEGELIEEEGCLSIPGIRGKVARSSKLTIQAQDLDGAPFTEEVEGLHARVVQHELDHLDGILFIQRLGESDRLLIKKALRKLEEESASGTRPASTRQAPPL